MPYQLHHEVGESMLRLSVAETLESDCVIDLNRDLTHYLDKVARELHLIVDVKQLQNIEPTLAEILRQTRTARTHHNLGYVVMVGGSAITDIIVSVLTSALPVKVLHARTIDDARHHINKRIQKSCHNN